MSHAPIRPKTRCEIAAELKISYRTFLRRLKDANIKLSAGLVYPRDQYRIYESIYWLDEVDRSDYRRFRREK